MRPILAPLAIALLVAWLAAALDATLGDPLISLVTILALSAPLLALLAGSGGAGANRTVRER